MKQISGADDGNLVRREAQLHRRINPTGLIPLRRLRLMFGRVHWLKDFSSVLMS